MVALAPEVGLARDKFRLMNEPTEARLRAVEGAKNSPAEAVFKQQQATALSTLFNMPLLNPIDKWIASQDDPALDGAEAIRRLVEKGLRAK